MTSIDSCEYIWESGVGFAHSPQHNVVHDHHRAEILKLLLTCFSETMYLPPLGKWGKKLFCKNEPTHLSSGFATMKDSNRLAQLQRLAGSRNFSYSKYRYYSNQAAKNKGTDQTAQMRRLICAFVVHIWQKQVLSWCGSFVKHIWHGSCNRAKSLALL